MGAKKAAGLPARLQNARRRFERWRVTRKSRTRIPEPLWAAAVKLAEAYGVYLTAKTLGLDYYSLKKRLKEKSSRPRPAKAAPVEAPTFVELASPLRMSLPECTLELEDAAGAKMRIQVKGIEARDLTALSRSLWRGA
jgi:hypothetical protein